MKIKTVYAADDGKEFATEQDCLNYEYDLAKNKDIRATKEKLSQFVRNFCECDYDGDFTCQTIAEFLYNKIEGIEVIINERK